MYIKYEQTNKWAKNKLNHFKLFINV
jgi:hypothetical protein